MEKVGGSSGVGVWSKQTRGLLTPTLGKICCITRAQLFPSMGKIASINGKYCCN